MRPVPRKLTKFVQASMSSSMPFCSEEVEVGAATALFSLAMVAVATPGSLLTFASPVEHATVP